MTSNLSPLKKLLEAASNGSLSESQAAELDQQLASSSKARAYYLDWMTVEASIYDSYAHAAPQQPQTLTAASVPSKPIALRSDKKQRWASTLVLAASLAGVALISSLVTRVWVDRTSPFQAFPVVSSIPAESKLGRITATRNCRWANPIRGTGYNAPLRAGDRLDLEAGLAEITFTSGVTVILEGPASLDLRDASEAVLVNGQLAAKIPLGAQQPRLRTGRFGAFEPGAEFGMVAGNNGGELHVFRGQLSATLFGDTGQQLSAMQLATAEGVRVTPTSNTPAKLVADDDRFVRSLSSVSGPHNGLYLQESFDYLDGPVSPQNGGFGWAGPWADIETAPDPTGVATNCTQLGSLEFAGMTSTGGRAVQRGQQNRVRRTLSTSVGGVFDAAGLVENRDGHRLIGSDGKTVYVSFLQRVDKTDDVFYGFELHRGDGNSNRVLCIGNGADGAGYGVTSNYNAYGAANYPSLGEENTEVNLIVARIDFGSSDFDKVRVYRNPRSLTDESECRVDAELKGNFAFDRVSLGNFEGTKLHEIDEIRIGTSYRAVAGQRDLLRDALERRVASLQYEAGQYKTGPSATFRILTSAAKKLSSPTLGSLWIVSKP